MKSIAKTAKNGTVTNARMIWRRAMAEVLKALLCCFGPALLYQLWKTIRKRIEDHDDGLV